MEERKMFVKMVLSTPPLIALIVIVFAFGILGRCLFELIFSVAGKEE